MSLRYASQCIASRSSGLRSSYADISRFIRTRHHGITLCSAACSRNSVRSFASSNSLNEVFKPDEELRRALDNFKETLPSLSEEREEENHFLTSLNKAKPGTEVTLQGYLMTRRDVNKKLSFAILRNKHQTFSIQLVSTSNTKGSEEATAHERLRTLREWTPVRIKGTLKEREPPPTSNASGPLTADQREVVLKSVVPLNEIPTDIIIKEDATYGPEQRHLQLRTSEQLRENLMLRHRVSTKARSFLNEKGWKEIETPILFKSTPEGAREFLVPSRNKGFAYALPQSPQQYKQILMASGIDKYFQFARCFRDEDLRADRQPEFTQLDMEMAWADESVVMETVENLLRALWFKEMDTKLPRFPQMTYQQAMASYGSDKPDLRFSTTIHSITEYLPQDLIRKITPLQDPIIDAIKIKLSDDPKANRTFVSNFFDGPEGKAYLNNPDGQPATFLGDTSQPMNGLGPLGYQFTMECPKEVATDHGDLLILQARKNQPFFGGSTMLGNLRLALHKAAAAQGLIQGPSSTLNKFVWITDFPLFSPTNDTDPGQGGTAGLASTHHPFTAPKTAADVELLLTDPTKAVAAHYDIVLNGVELGGGSRRIHNADVQEFIFRDVLKMRPERIEDFRHLMDVLRSGCPPHAGIALGWDRVVALMQKTDTVRDVIAFPKSGSGEDQLVKAPNRLTEEQLDTYHLRLRE